MPYTAVASPTTSVQPAVAVQQNVARVSVLG